MAPYVLRRWDEPHLFDALCELFASSGYGDGRYGTVFVRHEEYEYFFKTPTEMLVFSKGFGSFTALEDAALNAYNKIADEYYSEQARDIAAYDPSFGGRPHCTVL